MVKVKLLLKGILTAEDAKMAPMPASTASSSPTMAAAWKTASAPPSTRCRKSSPRSAAACRCWSTAASATAATSSRRWRSARKAVCIGRPYLWGLGAFGQAGVERVLGILRYETRLAMQQLGAPTLKDITPDMVRRV